MSKKYYKVVTYDVKSLGLRRNPNILSFVIGGITYEPNPEYGDWYTTLCDECLIKK